jgi:hypothetical protein
MNDSDDTDECRESGGQNVTIGGLKNTCSDRGFFFFTGETPPSCGSGGVGTLFVTPRVIHQYVYFFVLYKLRICGTCRLDIHDKQHVIGIVGSPCRSPCGTGMCCVIIPSP